MISRQTSSIYWAKLALVLSLLFSTTQTYCAAQGRYNEAEGKYLDPQVKTNVNKVDPLFDENIHDYRSFERGMLEHKKGIAAGVGRGLGTKDVVGASDAENTASRLSQISANDLESRGRAKAAEDPLLNEIFVDYSKPGNMQIKKDMEEIAESSGNMMKVILGMLKDLGVDCKSVKGNTQIEPQYHIDLKSRTDRDKGETVYDPHFCEQPRREYNCTDEVTVTCKRKGMKWGEWQDKEITVPVLELLNFGEYIFEVGRFFHHYLLIAPQEKPLAIRRDRNDVYYMPNPSKIQTMRKFLAGKHPNATIDNISEEMVGKEEGNEISISGKSYMGRVLGGKDLSYPFFRINYKYRDGRLSCLEWSEDWGEECQLQQ